MTELSAGIRNAELKDAAAIADIHEAAWLGAYRGIMSGRSLERMISRRGLDWWTRAIRSKAEILVLDACGTTAGYVTVGRSRMRTLPFKGEIYELYLLPEFQGLGFGKRLLAGARDQLNAFGLAGHAVRVLEDNEQACAFYACQGASRVSHSVERVGDDTLTIAVYGWMATR